VLFKIDIGSEMLIEAQIRASALGPVAGSTSETASLRRRLVCKTDLTMEGARRERISSCG